MGDIFQAVVASYLCMFVIKWLLLMGSFPAAIAAISRARTGERFDIASGAMLFVGISIYTLLMWPKTLNTEGLKFFGVYSNYYTMRQILVAFQLAVANTDDDADPHHNHEP